jgi:hypothetical protein
LLPVPQAMSLGMRVVSFLNSRMSPACIGVFYYKSELVLLLRRLNPVQVFLKKMQEFWEKSCLYICKGRRPWR